MNGYFLGVAYICYFVGIFNILVILGEGLSMFPIGIFLLPLGYYWHKRAVLE